MFLKNTSFTILDSKQSVIHDDQNEDIQFHFNAIH